MKLYKTTRGPVIELAGRRCLAPEQDWDALFNHDDLATALVEMTRQAPPVPADLDLATQTLALVKTYARRRAQSLASGSSRRCRNCRP